MKIYIILSMILLFTVPSFAGECAGIATGLYEKAKKASNPGEACKYCEEAIKQAQFELPANYEAMTKIVESCRDKIMDFQDKVSEAKIRGKLLLGMSKDDVLSMKGNPKKINNGTYSSGTHEQWVYGDYGPYLYFENGVLTAHQD